MSTPAVDVVLEELRTAALVLEAQIQGLIYLIDINSNNAELVELLTTELEDHVRRKKLVDAAIDALEALNADGYPDMPQAEISSGLYASMQTQREQIDAAIAQFTPVESEAASVTVELGEPVDNNP